MFCCKNLFLQSLCENQSRSDHAKGKACLKLEEDLGKCGLMNLLSIGLPEGF
jgi:hypothetical protein